MSSRRMPVYVAAVLAASVAFVTPLAAQRPSGRIGVYVAMRAAIVTALGQR